MAGETTPLLHRHPENAPSDRRPSSEWLPKWIRKALSVENRLLLAGFLITLSFSFTQVPLFYVFHLMTCDVYYDEHPPYEGVGDRCSRDEIAAGTARQFSFLGMSTTLCGTMNLFVAGWTVKKFGARAALLIQTLIPAVRVSAQIIGVMAGKMRGMVIIQATQLITVFGGPAGYILVVNIIAGEVVEPERRTILFGMLQGAIMLGQGLGYLTGGMIGDSIDIRAPFDAACISFLVASAYARFALPYLPPPDQSSTDPKKPRQGVMAGFLAPLRILAPQRLRLPDGRTRKHYGVLFLCAGIFVGVLATGYAPMLMQMYATAAFEFDQGDNGWLMAEFAFMRGAFLILIFPRLIAMGRGFVAKTKQRTATTSGQLSSSAMDEGNGLGNGLEAGSEASSGTCTPIPTDPGNFHATSGEQADEEPVRVRVKQSEHDSRAYTFDLVFLRWSLVVDGALTTVAAFATKRWHIYLAASLLPFGSGSAPAAKGVITEMCSESQRGDALNAVTLVENVARLATQGLFGFVFASLAQMGKAYATFFCNAAVAGLGMLVLLFSHFPPAECKIIDDCSVEDEGGEERGQTLGQ